MRISIPKPQLLKSLQMVEHAVNDRSALPILANVLLETNDKELILTATDLDVGIQCRFPLTLPTETGAVALPARKLATIIRELPEELVVLEAKKNHTATVQCGTSSFRIPGLPAEDFPTLPVRPEEGKSIIAQAALKALITQTAHAMSSEETRFILNGALLTIQKNDLVVVATDGRRLAVARAPLTVKGELPLHVVVPAKTIRELGRLLQDDAPDDVSLALLKDHQLAFSFGAATVITRLIEGQFPQYEKVIPPVAKHKVTADRQALIDAIRRASLMTTATSQAVVFELEEKRVIVSKESAELGSSREELPVHYTGERTTMAFNPEFWLDVLKVLETTDVAIEISGPERPAVIRQPEFTYVVLPMKVA
ncbi:MAG: DNA polymerase III subunit beta [Candidatus Omnitrophica bacterium]|nr:DNA polymerase III subunit beta [Candidatus Omnitrophota bacterium]